MKTVEKEMIEIVLIGPERRGSAGSRLMDLGTAEENEAGQDPN